MQYLFTHHDIDSLILLELPLLNLQKIYQTNRYIRDLGETNMMLKNKYKLAKNKVEQFMIILNKRGAIILQPQTANDLFKPYNDILNALYVEIDLGDDTEEIINGYTNLFIHLMNVEIINNGFISLTFTLHSNIVVNREDIQYIYNIFDPPNIIETLAYELTLNQLKEFLLHLFYNNMVISF